jgi:dinuclear metal center YbgI/SA1388 family protein
MILSEILQTIETFAPLSFQESYDNAGLYCGDRFSTVERVLVSLDITEEIVEEAIAQDCQLVMAHHPVIFKPIKRLVGDHYVERILLKAIRNGIALYAAHTNLDAVAGGVNYKLAQKIGLNQVQLLDPAGNSLRKLVVFVPVQNAPSLLEALYKAGAGQIGKYKNCSFRGEGTGTFMPDDQANPFIGKAHIQEEVRESRIEVLFPSHLTRPVLAAMRSSHPYEEVAYFVQELVNTNQDLGAGAIGNLARECAPEEFLALLRSVLPIQVIRHTPFKRNIKKVALCGGSGSFLLKKAMEAGADAFVSSDFKYHEFFDADGKILIADVGHYESEYHTKELIQEVLKSQYPDLEVVLSQVDTNPIRYFS